MRKLCKNRVYISHFVDYFQTANRLPVNYGSSKTVPQTQKKRRPRSGSDARIFFYSLFVSGQTRRIFFYLEPINNLSKPFKTHAPGTAHSLLGNCTATRREPQNRHGEPQRATQQRRGTTQTQPGTTQTLPFSPGINTPAILKSDAAESCMTAPLLEVLFIGHSP